MIDERIKQRIAGRKHAAECAGLFDLHSLGDDGSESFFDHLRSVFPKWLAKPVPAPPEPQPMSDLQAKAFGASLMTFGKHAGTRIDQVPLEYLLWLADAPDEWKADLRRYLKSRRVQIEQDTD